MYCTSKIHNLKNTNRFHLKKKKAAKAHEKETEKLISPGPRKEQI